MKKYQVINSNDKVVFEGTEDKFKVFVELFHLNDSDTVRMINQ